MFHLSKIERSMLEYPKTYALLHAAQMRLDIARNRVKQSQKTEDDSQRRAIDEVRTCCGCS